MKKRWKKKKHLKQTKLQQGWEELFIILYHNRLFMFKLNVLKIRCIKILSQLYFAYLSLNRICENLKFLNKIFFLTDILYNIDTEYCSRKYWTLILIHFYIYTCKHVLFYYMCKKNLHFVQISFLYYQLE